MRLVALMLMWRRPVLTEIVMRHWLGHQESARPTHHIDLLAVGSEGNASRELAERNGFHYIETHNESITQKYNCGMSESRAFDPDAVIRAESDDLFSQHAIEACVHHMNLNERSGQNVGFEDLYFLDAKGWRLGYLPPCGVAAGGGQVLRRDLLARFGWRPFDDHALKRDDILLDALLAKRIGPAHCLRLVDHSATIIDVKGEGNMVPYDRLAEFIRPVHVDRLHAVLPFDTIEALRAYGQKLP